MEQLARLPGIGPKTSERLAYHLLTVPLAEARSLAEAILAAREATVVCGRCFQFDEQDPCSICADPSRDRTRILVVEDPRDVASFEEAGWRGLYHVLQGRISQLEGISPEDLTTGALLARVAAESPVEVCFATSPDLEGEGTARVIAERLRAAGTNVTRIARGIPAGASIAQVGKSILADSIEGRRGF
jgi:recombination protein RecR